MKAARKAATIFLKKAFCIVGTSPESRTKTVISEKKKAADRINRIPFFITQDLRKEYRKTEILA